MAGSLNHYQGIGAGLIIGDAHCAPYEGGPLERGLWWLIGRTAGKRRFTDDSQMAFDLGHHLIQKGRIEHQALAMVFANNYQWSRDYGPSTVAVLNQIKKGRPWQDAATHKFKDGSFGNGAAMRVAPLAVFLHQRVSSVDQLQSWVLASAEVTHPNQQAIDGATAIALCLTGTLNGMVAEEIINTIVSVIKSPTLKEKIEKIGHWITSGTMPSVPEAKRILGAGTAASESCAIALYIGLMGATKPLSFIIESSNVGGGDTDTIGAMAGAIWGAHNGLSAIPQHYIDSTEGIDEMNRLIHQLRETHPTER